jgi:thiol-disulfide isomerase/thioredoxin
MRHFTIILFFLTTIGHSQSDNQTVYNWDYVIKYIKKNRMDATKGTKEIIYQITSMLDSEAEQMELIRFYRDAYDYKIVDKIILQNLIDSLQESGLSDAVRSFATESINLIEYRLLNKKIIDFEFPNRNGELVKLSSLNDKIVIIELWATWCAPCIKEMPKIPGLRRRNPNVEFYSISVDKTQDKMHKFVDKNKYDWPIVFGGDQEQNKELWDYLNIVAIPKYYTVDREGIVINVSDKLDEEFVMGLK